jgi:hypothetical protein
VKGFQVLITIAATIFATVVVYKFLTRRVRHAVLHVAKTLNVKPALIDGMLTRMGKSRAQMLVNSLASFPNEALNDAVYTFFMYRIFVVNRNQKEIKWWIERIESKGFDRHLDIARVEISSMHLRNCIDAFELRSLVSEYNETYAPTRRRAGGSDDSAHQRP